MISLKGSELLRTLKVYLDHDGSKQIAAQQLFIVRQSLYYRLEKIEELLGADYMLPRKELGAAGRDYGHISFCIRRMKM